MVMIVLGGYEWFLLSSYAQTDAFPVLIPKMLPNEPIKLCKMNLDSELQETFFTLHVLLSASAFS